MKPQYLRDPARPYPRGWFCVGWSSDVKSGQAVSRELMGREVIIFRGKNGVVSVVDSHCPHLGAHFLNSGGGVVGDTLRCGFHGFRFSGDGKCVATGYDSPPPRELCVPSYKVTEIHQAILVWFDPDGGGPLWELPAESDANEWSPMVTRDFRIPVHLVDQVENTVDRGHFQHVHLGQKVEFTKKPTFGDNEFSFAIDAEQPQRVTKLFKLESKQFVARLAAEVRGLGLIKNSITFDVLGAVFRVMVFPTPRCSAFDLDVRIGFSVKDDPDGRNDARGIGALSAKLPKRWRHWALNQLFRYASQREVDVDTRALASRRYIARPLLAKGDGPILQYRQWADKFYAPRDVVDSKTLQLRARPSTETASSSIASTPDSPRRA
jgi:cholesterol 7-desaturase